MNSAQPQVREAGHATLLPSVLGPLHWGSIYLRSIQFFQIFGPAARSNQLEPVASVFQGTFAWDKRLRHSQLALQYRPNVQIANGETSDNHDLLFDAYYNHPISARSSINVAEELAYRSSRNQYADTYLAANTLSGTVVQNNFLEGPVEWLTSSTSLTAAHALSARTQLSFGPQFTYIYSGAAYQQNTPISSETYGGVASLTHALSPTRNVGLSYSVQRITASRTFAGTIYQTVSTSYSQQFAPNWRVNFSVGASTSNFLGNRQWNATGNFSLLRSFQRSSLVLSYVRGHGFSGYVNNGETERADVNYSVSVTRRAGTQFGAGYESTTSTVLSPGASQVRVSGVYATAGASYQLSSSLSWFASYTYRNQISHDPQVFPGIRTFAVTGITWSPRPK